MKNLILLLFIPFFSSAKCDHIKGNGHVTSLQREINTFNKIATAGSVDVIIEQGSEEGVKVTTDENLQQYVVTEVKNNTLSIHLKDNVSFSSTKLIVHVTCRNLNAISSGGSGDVTVVNGLKSEDLEISQGGSGDFDLSLNVNKLEISKAGSGDFKLEGRIMSLEVSSAGSGDLDAGKTNIGEAEISMVGSGDVLLPRGIKPKVSSVGSGEVRYE